mgnify:CR=1 FL=1
MVPTTAGWTNRRRVPGRRAAVPWRGGASGRRGLTRRVRDGESSEVDTASIRKNDDVIMPRQWYAAQDLPLHEYYEGSYPASSRPSSSMPRAKAV